jgi:CheY-like chemotaxis protein/HPt (histidine-containing phosphotransfer) domain-containing protein
LKRDPVTAEIPVIALTAMAMKADQEKTRVAGCDAYIAKPLRYQELYAVIDAQLLKAGMHPVEKTDPVQLTSASLTTSSDNREGVFELPSRDRAIRDGRLILVAEDNESNQKIILRQLALLGFAADVVGDGRLALQRWQSGDYALLLSDLQMPEMNGYELIAAIRAEEQGSRRIPIVTMTASYSKQEANRYRTPDMDDFLNKPLQRGELLSILNKWLPTTDCGMREIESGNSQADVSKALDVSVLERLVGNDPDVVQGFLSEFRTSAGRIATKLRLACVERQSMEASNQAHKLMSSSNAVGALALGELCLKMETAGRAGNVEEMAALLPRFEHELNAVNASLDALSPSREIRVDRV